MIYDQKEFDVRCEWGLNGLQELAPISDVVIIVDVLSFSTAVDMAVSRGAFVYPYKWKDGTASEFSRSIQAVLAEARKGSNEFSLSPKSLAGITSGTKLVLPSPNGSTLSLSTGKVPTLAGCLRNADTIALAAMTYGKRIAVVPAGERWSDGTFRPAFEDIVGAGAIISKLKLSRSPEAEIAFATYEAVKSKLAQYLMQCSSGKELISRGFGNDVTVASELNVSKAVPTLKDSAYVNVPIRAASRKGAFKKRIQNWPVY